MKTNMKPILLLGLLFSVMLFPADDDERFWNYADILPGAWSLPGYLEAYQPESTLLIEESNGFALADRLRIYFDGWSPRALPWDLNDVSFGSRLNPGTAQGLLPFATRSAFSLAGPQTGNLSAGVRMTPYSYGCHSSLTLSTVFANLGSYSPWAQSLISTPATERDEMLYDTRRSLHDQYLLDGQWSMHWGQNRQLNIALSHTGMNRSFNDWNERDSQFDEKAEFSTLYADYRHAKPSASYRLWLLINRLQRDHLGAELGVLPQETLDLNSSSWSGGLVWKRWNWQLSVLLGYERERTNSNFLNYRKDIYDNDGDLILSQKPFGRRGSLNFNGRLQRDPEQRKWLRPYLDWQFSAFDAQERIHAFSPLTLDGQAYGVIVWDGSDSRQQKNRLYQAKTGIMMDLPLSKSLKLGARAELGVNGFFGETLAQNASLAEYGLHGQFNWCWKPGSELTVSASHGSQPLTADLVDFMETARPGGAWYRWLDANGNSRYDEGESGALLRRTGGAAHSLADDFKLPSVSQIQLSLKFPLSRKWAFELHGTGKRIHNAWTVRYAQEYGSWQEIDRRRVYLLSKPVESYVLTNLEADRQKPQYWQLMFRFIGEKPEKWYFSFSFMAHMGLAETPFGNGPDSNDYLAVSESSADPNGWINSYGRLDGDRAFVAKIAYGLHLSRRLSLGVSAKYRDGNPFAFLRAQMIDDQLVMQYATLKGEDQHGNKLGPREDYLSEVNLKLTYRFPLLGGSGRLALEWFNLIDVGYELSEYVYAVTGRPPLELTIPRSIRLSFGWQAR